MWVSLSRGEVDLNALKFRSKSICHYHWMILMQHALAAENPHPNRVSCKTCTYNFNEWPFSSFNRFHYWGLQYCITQQRMHWIEYDSHQWYVRKREDDSVACMHSSRFDDRSKQGEIFRPAFSLYHSKISLIFCNKKSSTRKTKNAFLFFSSSLHMILTCRVINWTSAVCTSVRWTSYVRIENSLVKIISCAIFFIKLISLEC